MAIYASVTTRITYTEARRVPNPRGTLYQKWERPTSKDIKETIAMLISEAKKDLGWSQ